MRPAEATTRLHEDRDLFVESLRFTAAQTRFTPRLIEKDYFCTLLLQYLARDETLVFKGGTCLAKVHAGFYRLSEDLDFAVPVPVNASRAARRRRAAPMKHTFATLPGVLAAIHILEPLVGANNSTQYLGVVGYRSPLSNEEETIKLEVALREPLLTPPQRGRAHTLLLNPITNEPTLEPIDVPCISSQEAFAEKFRASLTRRQPAVRDFFDIDHATTHQGLQAEDQELVRLVRMKLTVPGTEVVDVSSRRLADLRLQLEPELKPVLREEDFEAFDLERAFKTVAGMAERLEDV